MIFFMFQELIDFSTKE